MALFVRVKDPVTGHEFDVREDSILLRRELVKRIKPAQYPPSRTRRRAKHHLDLAARRPVSQDPATTHHEESTDE